MLGLGESCQVHAECGSGQCNIGPDGDRACTSSCDAHGELAPAGRAAPAMLASALTALCALLLLLGRRRRKTMY